MYKTIFAVVAISTVLSGCQGLVTKPQPTVEFSGYLEQPVSPLLIELKPTTQYIYKTETTTGSDTATTYAEESITQTPYSLTKRVKLKLAELLEIEEDFRIDLVVSLLPNGIVTKFEIDEQSFELDIDGQSFKAENDSDRAAAEEFKLVLMESFEKTGIVDITKRFPDYAWGQRVNTGFKSKCWREEMLMEKLLVTTVNQSRNRKIPDPEIITDSESECGFLGITYIQGRKGAVFKERVHSTFKRKGSSDVINVFYTGWRALDIDKGLILESDHALTMDVNGRQVDEASVSTKISMVTIKYFGTN